MASNINIEGGDRVYSIKPTWHRLEEIRESLTRANIPELDSKIVRLQTFVNLPDGTQVPYVDHTGKAISVVAEKWSDTDGTENITMFQAKGESFCPINFGEMLDIVDAGLADVPHEIATVGTFGSRANAWVSVEIKDANILNLGGNDTIETFVSFMDSRIGLYTLSGVLSSIRTVCANTFGMNQAIIADIMGEKYDAIVSDGQRFAFRAKHTPSIKTKIDAIKASIPLFFAGREAFQKSLLTMQSETVSKDRLHKLLLGFYAQKTDLDVSKGGILSTRSINQVNAVGNLFTNGKGNNGKTLYDAFNAVTEYYTSGDGSGSANVNPFKKMVNSDFTTGAQIKADWFQTLLSDDAIDNLVKQGEKMLSNAKDLDLAIA